MQIKLIQILLLASRPMDLDMDSEWMVYDLKKSISYTRNSKIYSRETFWELAALTHFITNTVSSCMAIDMKEIITEIHFLFWSLHYSSINP